MWKNNLGELDKFRLVVWQEGSAMENAPSPQGQRLVLKGASIRGVEALLAGLLQAMDKVSEVGGTRLRRAVWWRTWAVGRWTVQPVVLEGSWHDVISQQVCVRNNNNNNNSGHSLAFTGFYCRHTLYKKLKARSTELSTQIHINKCENRQTALHLM